jgi:flagellar protein FliL
MMRHIPRGQTIHVPEHPMAKKAKETEETAEGGDEKSSRLPSKKVMIMALAGLLAVGAGGGGYWWFFKKGNSQAAVAQTDGRGGTAPRKAAFMDLPEMTVNLAAGTGQTDRQQFLRMKIALEVAEQKVVSDIQPMLPRIVDTFQVYMRELRPQDLEGSSGVYRLKEELIRRVNVAVYPQKVDAVLFKELMVQ